MGTNTIRLHRVFRASPERINRAFLDADAMAKWLPPNGFTGYVDEILWQARIAPTSVVSKIPSHIIDDLVISIRSVLIDTIEEIKRRSPETFSDEVRDFLRVHNPKRSGSTPEK